MRNVGNFGIVGEIAKISNVGDVGRLWQHEKADFLLMNNTNPSAIYYMAGNFLWVLIFVKVRKVLQN